MTVRETEDRLAQLEAEVTRLRADNLEIKGRVRAQERGTGEADRRRMTRSDFLRFGGAAAAGAVVAGASGLLSARRAEAYTGDPMLAGFYNYPSAPGDTTYLNNPVPVPDQLSPMVFWVQNLASPGFPFPAARVAAAGTTSGGDTTLLPKVGLWGQTGYASNRGAGVVGRGGTTGADPLVVNPSGGSGVVGTATDGGNGVVGAADGSSGFAVIGKTDAGYGVIGDSATGISVDVRSGGRLHQVLRGTAGPPTSGSFNAGEQLRDANAELWLCVVGGSPGTWRRAATVKEGFNGGSVNLLSKPIRIFDSRSGAPLAPGASVDVQITGVVVGGVSVPAGAVGMVGNVAVTQTVAPSGYLTLYPQASPPSPATASVNWFGPNQDLNTAVLVALNPANGKLTIHNGIAGGSAPTHVVLDASAFVI